MKRILIGLSVALNVLVIAAIAWFMFGGGLQMFAEGFIKPAHERWVSQFDIHDVQPGDTVFLGDSITEGGSWHELFEGVPVRNRGIGGDVTSGVLARLEQITRGDPAQVFLLIGTNDLGFGEADDHIVNNILEIIDRIDTQSPGTEVYVQSVLPRAANYQERIEGLNAKLREAIHGKAKWIDLYPHFLNAADGSIDNAYSNDELHLNGAGYDVWRSQISSLVGR